MFGLRFKEVYAITHWDDGEETVEIKTKPWLTEWSSMILPQAREGFHPRAMGYRFLEHRPWARTDVYARPLLVWLYLGACLHIGKVFWGTVDWLGYKHGFIHFRTPEGLRIRWRDLGLGPDPKGKR